MKISFTALWWEYVVILCYPSLTFSITFFLYLIQRIIFCSYLIPKIGRIIPINLINRSILNPEKISTWFPFITVETATKFVTFLSGVSQILLFSICPTFFKYIACKDGKSTSVQQMEQRAMMYFWYFFIVARYLGQFLIIAVLELFFQGKFTYLLSSLLLLRFSQKLNNILL